MSQDNPNISAQPFQPPSQPQWQSSPNPSYPQIPSQPLPPQAQMQQGYSQPQWQQQPYPQQPMYPPQMQQGYSQPQWQQQSYPQQPMYPPQMQPSQQPNSMYPPQPQYYPYSMQPPIQVNQIVQVNVGRQGHGFLVRALWYIFIGWWLGFFWLNVGYFFCITIIGLPLGLIMLNRLPWVLTLRPASTQVNVQVAGNVATVHIGAIPQYSFLGRAVYFIFVGSWLGYLWASVGYACCLFIVTLPLGLVMLNRLPAVLTLRRN